MQSQEAHTYAPIHEKTHRPQNSDGLIVTNFLADLLHHFNDCRKVVETGKVVKSLWINRRGGPMSETSVTESVVRIFDRYCGLHVTPATIRQLCPTLVFEKNIQVPGRGEEGTLIDMSFTMDTSVNMMNSNYNRGTATRRMIALQKTVVENLFETEESKQAKQDLKKSSSHKRKNSKSVSESSDEESEESEESEEESEESEESEVESPKKSSKSEVLLIKRILSHQLHVEEPEFEGEKPIEELVFQVEWENGSITGETLRKFDKHQDILAEYMQTLYQVKK
jgi:hypothetical protein